LTGGGQRASTVGLLALVGTQLGQTLLSGGMSRPVVVTSLGSAAAMAAIVQTPGISQMFGCRPIGPVGWLTALAASAGATAAAQAFPEIVNQAMLWLRLDERVALEESEQLPEAVAAPELSKGDVAK
jgi:hypothetical protein